MKVIRTVNETEFGLFFSILPIFVPIKSTNDYFLRATPGFVPFLPSRLIRFSF